MLYIEGINPLGISRPYYSMPKTTCMEADRQVDGGILSNSMGGSAIENENSR